MLLNSKLDIKYIREGRVCVAVVSTCYIFPCSEALYISDVRNHVINYLDYLENVEYPGMYMCADNSDSEIKGCKIKNFEQVRADSCDKGLAFTECQ